MSTTRAPEQPGYDEIIAAGAASLGLNEFWCIHHPDGPLEETASRDLAHPIRVICEALDMDWDDLTEQGFRLGRVSRPSTSPWPSPRSRLPWSLCNIGE